MEDFLDQWMLTFCIAAGMALMQAIGMGLRLVRPRAAAHLRHFLQGGGRDLHVDLHQWLDADTGLRATLFGRIRHQQRDGATEGRIAVEQVMAANGDWRWAMGSVVFDWQYDGDRVHVTCRDRYHFQPQVNRVSRPLHRLGAWLERVGAAASFDMVGRTNVPAYAVAHGPASPRRYTKLYL